tara:strand:- start:13750 stop:14553 length:804 start_codon:yes stop_codon:yes gene_type:complete
MYSFEYHRPKNIKAALRLFRKADDPIYVGGGMTLIPSMKQRLAAPTDLIDLSAVGELRGVAWGEKTLTLGAMNRHNEVVEDAQIQDRLPVLGELAASIGDNQVRNRGTLGGAIANADPAGDYPAAVVALGTRVITHQRSIAASEFFLDLFETALTPGEVIKAVEFAIPERASYAKFRHPASGYAVVGALVADYGDEVRVGITGAGPCAFRAKYIEQLLSQQLEPSAIEAVTVPDAGFISDIHASAAYRAHLVKIMVQRAVSRLLEAP